MERQGHFRGFQIVSGYSFVWVVLAVLLLSVGGWGSCSATWTTVLSGSYCACDGPNFTPRPSTYPQYESSVSNLSSNCVAGPYACGAAQQCVVTGYSKTCCSNQCEADSVRCVRDGGTWRDDPSASCGKSCGAPCPESVCDVFRQQCEQTLKGTFTGNCVNSGEGGAACCHGYCDVCSGPAMTANYNEMKDVCCKKRLMAPPKIADVCLDTPPLQGGCGVYQSTFRTNGENWACHDPNQSQEMMDRYVEECFGESSSSGEGGGSSSGGASSGGESSSSGPSPYPEGCDECPWLDSILDTLTAQKKVIEDIKACVYYPALCNDDGEQIQIDTSILPYIRPFMDSTLKLDSNQLKALRDLDTNLLKILANDTNLFKIDSTILKIDSAMLKMDSAMLKSDSATRKTITGGVSTLDSTIDASSDSTKKWLKRLVDSSTVHSDSNMKYLKAVADSIGITADSLKAHLDSIMNKIPSDILDSILKYQKENAEKEDSVVIGSLDQLDSILDSTIVYWKKSQSADSARHAERNDSTEAIHKAIDDIAGRISEIIGYGDTATGDLRGDIKGVGDAVSDMRDSALKYWRQSQSADSAYRLQFGEGVATITGAVSGVQGSVEGLGGKLDSIFHVGTVDTGVVGFVIGDGNLTADSIANGYGYGRLNFARDTSDLNGALGAQFVEDSTSLCVGGECLDYESQSEIDAGFQRRLSSAADTLIQSNEEFYADSMDGMISRIVTTLDSINPFGVFDSTLVNTLGMKVPNTNTCPEHCSKFSVDIPFSFGVLPTEIDFGLCTPRVAIGNQNVLAFLRFLIRCIVAVTCIGLVVTNLPKSI